MFTASERAVLEAGDRAERPTIRWGLAGKGLGRLTYQEVVALHRPGITQRTVALAAGVDQSSVSRWRAANDFVQVYLPRWMVDRVLKGEPQ